jgi:AraC-like DNA-binding protein
MGLSRRSMQRRLSEHGWSYKRVVDDTRAELARRYMGDPSKSLTEIAFLLGSSRAPSPGPSGAGPGWRPGHTA